MVWYFYGTILLCSYVNWGNLITSYNISVNKGVERNFLQSLNYNDEIYLKYTVLHPDKIADRYDFKKHTIRLNQKKSFLSKALYYESVSVK